MNLTQLKNSVKVNRRYRKIVGRGESSGHGKTSTRGHNGQGQRTGYSRRSYFEGGQMPLIRKLPKRGFTRGRFLIDIAIVNVQELNRFSDKEVIDEIKLRETGLVKGAATEIKILGKGELNKSGLVVTAHHFSKSAIEQIQRLGGQVNMLIPPKPVIVKVEPPKVKKESVPPVSKGDQSKVKKESTPLISKGDQPKVKKEPKPQKPSSTKPTP